MRLTTMTIRAIPFLLVMYAACRTMPAPLAAVATAATLGIVSSLLWLLAGLVGPRSMGGRPLREAIDVATAEALERAAVAYSRRLGIRPPRLYAAPSTAGNALALGVGPTAAIVLTEGMLAELPIRALRAVVAHELAHVKRGDTRTYATAIATGGWLRCLAWSLIGSSIVVMRVLHLAGRATGSTGWVDRVGAVLQAVCDRAWALCDQVTVHMAAGVSMAAEYQADRLGAHLAGRDAMVDALARLERLNGRVGVVGWLAWHYATHPPIRTREEALRGGTP